MQTLNFRCTVNEPLILLKKAKSEQTTESLDYLPGNTFRGIIANLLFKDKIAGNVIDDIVFIMLEKDKNKPSIFTELRPLLVPVVVVLLGTLIGVIYFSRRSRKNEYPL